MTNAMAHIVYVLCVVTSALCALLLFRSHARSGRPFLFFCALSFVLLALNNALVLFDLMWFPEGDLVAYRQFAALAAVGVLIYGFMWKLD